MEITNPEFTFLCLCARTVLDSESEDKIRILVRSRIQWNRILELAQYHRVIPVVFKNLEATCSGIIPPEIQNSFENLARGIATINLFLSKELSRLSIRFEENGLPMISLKGPTLAKVAYGDEALRSAVDLDLFISKKNYSFARRVLEDADYQLHSSVNYLHGIREKFYIWQAGQLPFCRGSGLFTVDLHTGIMPPLYYFPMDFERLWSRTQIVSIAGKDILTCSAEDLLLILCFHGTKNRWDKMKYICDIAELIKSNLQMDWDTITDLAQRFGCLRILHVGISLTRFVLSLEFPETLAKIIGNNHQANKIASQLSDRLSSNEQLRLMSFQDRRRFHLSILDRKASKFRYVSLALLQRMTMG